MEDEKDTACRALYFFRRTATYGAIVQRFGGANQSSMSDKPKTAPYSAIVEKGTRKPSGYKRIAAWIPKTPPLTEYADVQALVDRYRETLALWNSREIDGVMWALGHVEAAEAFSEFESEGD